VAPVVRTYVQEVSDDPALGELLDYEERERAARRRDPARFVTAHALLRTVVAEQTGTPPSEVVFERRCMTCGSESHGKPVVHGHPGVLVSLSYAGRLAVVAVTAAGEVGVDVELAADADHEFFDSATLAAEETDGVAAVPAAGLGHARAQVWSRKEAVLKATGHGLVVDPRDVVVSGPLADAALVDWRGDRPIGSPVQLLDLPLDTTEYAAAVAVLCPDPVELVVVRR
jgi:4'-phosphopantetheinyl transferase